MVTPQIQFEECETSEKLAKLREFAATFEPPHVIHPCYERHRIVIAKRDGLWIGYAIISLDPVVYSAWSKQRCRPHDIWDAMKAFAGWARLQYGGGLTTVPLDTRTFPERIMNRLGFYRLKLELYATSEETTSIP